jgi:hypothetical protein
LDLLTANIAFWSENKSTEAGIEGSSISARQDQLTATFKIIGDGYQAFGLGYDLATVANLTNTALPVKNIEALLGFESIVFRKLAEQGICGLFFFMLFYLQSYTFIRRKCMIHDRGNVLIVDGFFLSYFASIVVTGIQATFYLFFMLSVVYLKYLYICKIHSRMDVVSCIGNNVNIKNR